MDIKYESGVFRTSACCLISCDSQLISSCCEKRMRRKNERPNEVRKLTEGCSVDVVDDDVDSNAISMPFVDRSLLLNWCFSKALQGSAAYCTWAHLTAATVVSFKFKLPLPISSHENVFGPKRKNGEMFTRALWLKRLDFEQVVHNYMHLYHLPRFNVTIYSI